MVGHINTFLQGTWQFMSAALVGLLDTSHGLMDDLESTLYVLLWMAMIYSSCKGKGVISTFLDHCLDPKMKPDGRFMGKADFLAGRTLFESIEFTGRPGLFKLTEQLAELFSARYVCLKFKTPTTNHSRLEAEQEEEYFKRHEQDVLDHPGDPYYAKILQRHPLYQRRLRDLLETHAHVIGLLTDTIDDTSLWVDDPAAAKQDFESKQSVVLNGTKTSWIYEELKEHDQQEPFDGEIGPIPSDSTDIGMEFEPPPSDGSDTGTLTSRNTPTQVALQLQDCTIAATIYSTKL